MNDYSLYTCRIPELVDQIIKKERLPKELANELKYRVNKLNDDTIYYKDYPYNTPLAFIKPNTTINDIFEERIKNHLRDHIMIFMGIAMDDEFYDNEDDLYYF